MRLAAGLVTVAAVVAYAAPFAGEYIATPRLGRRHALSLDPDAYSSESARAPIPIPKRGQIPAAAVILPNVLVNNPAGEAPGEGNTQMEPTLAASGDTVVCAFTDSKGIWGTGSLTGYAVSFDGGQTWTDRGSLPNAGASDKVYGDATMLTDGLGRWYCVSVYDIGNGVGGSPGDLALVLHTGQFSMTNLIWSAPRVIAGGQSGDAPDSPHAVLDVGADRLYVAYANLGMNYAWGQIEMLRIGNHGATDLGLTVVQPHTQSQNNAGPRLALGPNNEIYCAWESGLFTNNGQGPAMQKIARSVDSGVSFSLPVVAATVNESWLSGPPGFNRLEEFVEFPSLAVDRSSGPHRGRVYLTWHDAVWRNFDGAMTIIPETSASNDEPQTAQELPTSTAHWQIEGGVAGSDYFDWYRFHGDAGDHVRFILRPNTWMQLSTFLYCRPTGAPVDTIFAGSTRYAGDPVFFLFTLPFSGDYYIRVARHTSSGTYTGWLRRTTSTAPSTAIDHRDVVMVSSPDGLTGWSAKTRINDDTGFTDQAFPEVVVDGDGGAHVLWYDRRFDPSARVLADLVMASSFDGGQSFTPDLRVTSESSFWQVPSDAVPNFGDWFHPLAVGSRLLPAWADGRLGSPDVMVAPLETDFETSFDDSLRSFAGVPLELDVTVRNDSPYNDAYFDVHFDPSLPLVGDVTVHLGPVGSGETEIATFAPVVLGGLPGVWRVGIEVTSNRSAHVATGTATIFHDAVAVSLTDFSANAGSEGTQLDWRAEGSVGFHVERSSNAAGPYERLTSTILAASRGSSYTYLDTRPANDEQLWYRLIAIESDGASSTYGPYRVEAMSPRMLRFLGAQPNPFNPTTALRFELPHEARVTLRILDVRGREVATLLQSEGRGAGSHAVYWDGRGAGGAVQASGVYIAELRVQDVVRTARLVLLR